MDGFGHVGMVSECWQEQDGAAFPGILDLTAARGSQALSSPENPQPNTFGGGKESQSDQSLFPKPNSNSGHFSKGWKVDCLLEEDGCSLQ